MLKRDDTWAEGVAAWQSLQKARVAELAQITIGGGGRVAELPANDVDIDDRLFRAKQVENPEQATKAIHFFYILVQANAQASAQPPMAARAVWDGNSANSAWYSAAKWLR